MLNALSADGRAAMDKFVEDEFASSFGPGEVWPLGEAWRRAIGDQEAGCIAAAIVYRAHKAAGERGGIIRPARGPNADPLLCVVADDLELE